jgi:uncharacterized membrane protein
VKGPALPWWGYGLLALAVLVSLLAYPHLPARLAMHFDAAFRPNGWLPKPFALLLPLGLMALLAVLWQVLWRIDPRRERYRDFWPTYRLMGGLVQGFLFLALVWTIGRNLGLALASTAALPLAIGVLFVLLMNLLPRLHPNWWMGIRTPWTLSDEGVWRKTHRLAGEAGVAAGFLLIAGALLLPAPATAVATVVVVGLWVAVSVGASYVYYQHRG